MKDDKNNIKGYNKRKGALPCNFAHNIVDMSSSADKKAFISNLIEQIKECNTAVDVIAVTDKASQFNSLVKSCNGRREDAVGHISEKAELIGVIRSIESLIAVRSMMFNATNASDFAHYNQIADEKMSAIVIAFDLNGSELWSEDNKTCFLRVTKMMEVAHVFGISFTFFNVAPSMEKLNLQFYANPQDLAA